MITCFTTCLGKLGCPKQKLLDAALQSRLYLRDACWETQVHMKSCAPFLAGDLEKQHGFIEIVQTRHLEPLQKAAPVTTPQRNAMSKLQGTIY